MKYTKTVWYYLFGFLMLSCTQLTNNIKDTEKVTLDIEQDIKIQLPAFKSVEIISNPSIGDYSKTIVIEFDSLNFEHLLSKTVYNVDYINTKQKDDNKRKKWEPYDSGYRIENCFSDAKNRIIYYINIDKRTLICLHIEE